MNSSTTGLIVRRDASRDEGAPRTPVVGSPPFPAGRFLSIEECQSLIQRILGFTTGGGRTDVSVRSLWSGNLRWARNGIISCGDLRNNVVSIGRFSSGQATGSTTNVLDDRHLRWTVQRGERWAGLVRELPETRRADPPFLEEYLKPKLWYDRTYHQDAAQRAELMQRLVQPAQAAGMLSAGYLEVSATGEASMDGAQLWYYPYTQAEYTVTVRTPDGTGSGWAGVDHNDWAKVDAEKLSAIALEKCLRSRNPVRLEPGRYTTILEPQAVGEFVQSLFSPNSLDRAGNERGDPKVLKTDPRYKKDPQGIYNDGPGYSKLGERVMDARLTVRTDCTDPNLGFPPFQGWTVYKPVTWIEDGVLKALAYDRNYAVQKLHQNTGGLNQYGVDVQFLQTGAFRMSVTGEMVSVDEMITTTKRGLLVTRFALIQGVSNDRGSGSGLRTGYTRDGVWLIENGKLSKAVKNFRFTESPMFALNNIEQLGVPQRIYHPGWPIIVPPMKVRDFSFTGLSDAV